MSVDPTCIPHDAPRNSPPGAPSWAGGGRPVERGTNAASVRSPSCRLDGTGARYSELPADGSRTEHVPHPDRSRPVADPTTSRAAAGRLDRHRHRHPPLGDYADTWLTQRQLKPRTRAHYRTLLDKHILPTYADTPVRSISPAMVPTWHPHLSPDTPTLRAHAYGLLRAILHTAVYDGRSPPTPPTSAAPAPPPAPSPSAPPPSTSSPPSPRHAPDRQAMILLAAWCGLGSARSPNCAAKTSTSTRRRGRAATSHRAVTRVDGQYVITTPKSAAGRRDVALPPHLIPALQHHLDHHAAPGPDALLFPAAGDPTRHLAPASLYKTFYRARNIAGRPDLRWHDLRHTGAVLAAHTGATLAELMNRLGHSTPAAALRYQHATNDRDTQIANALSQLATTSNP